MKTIILILLIQFIGIDATNAQSLSGKYKLISTTLKDGKIITASNKDSMVVILSQEIYTKITAKTKKPLTIEDSLNVIESGKLYYNNLFEETLYLTKENAYSKYSISNNSNSKLLASQGYYEYNEDSYHLLLTASGAFINDINVSANYDKTLQTISCMSDTTNNKALYIKDVYKKIANCEKLEDETSLIMDTAKMELQQKYFPEGFTSLYVGAHKAYVNIELPKLSEKSNDIFKSVDVKCSINDETVIFYKFVFNDTISQNKIDEYMELHYGKFTKIEENGTYKFTLKDDTTILIWNNYHTLFICNALNF